MNARADLAICRLIAWLLFFFTAIACQQVTQEKSVYEPQLVQREVLQMLNDYYNDIRKEGLLAEFRYLDSSDDFFWVPPGYQGPISFDSVRTVLTATAPSLRSMDNRWENLIVHPINNETATYSGNIRSIMVDSSGKSTTMFLQETGIVVKRKDGWKLVAGQTAVAANK